MTEQLSWNRLYAWGGQVGSDIKVWRDISRGASEAQLDKDAADAVTFERYMFEG